MSDDDRLADYLRRIEGDPTPRTLSDGCDRCNHSLVFCRCSRYMDLGTCCQECSHQ